jgi:hypothetical protein|tara:strand:- start:44 stop:412 length:369 start_codon:yes stop_codon:yes gene_type:complete
VLKIALPRRENSSELLLHTKQGSSLTSKLFLHLGLNKMAPKAKPLSEATKAALRKKAEGTRFTYGQLAAVYRRGQGAYLSSGSRNVSMAAWAMGRVNSFVSGKGGARKADADLLKKNNSKKQ